MEGEAVLPDRLHVVRGEQVQLALARLVVVGTFLALWLLLWIARIPYPVPFLVLLCLEGALMALYLRVITLLRSEAGMRALYYATLGIELVLLTIMVYFLGGLTYFGSYAYVFGLIFTNAFFDLRRGFIYTAMVVCAYSALAVIDGAGAIPHYAYLQQSALRYRDPRFVATSIVSAAGVFFGIFAWVNWVGYQLRRQRDVAVSAQTQLAGAQGELERRVEQRTAALAEATAEARASAELLSSTMESTADGILVVETGGAVAYTNGRFAEMWRIPPALLVTDDDEQLLRFVLDQLSEPEIFLKKVHELYSSEREDLDTLVFKDGREFERYSRPLLSDGTVKGRVWSFRDVSDRRRSEEQLIYLANHDALTGLLNRRRFEIDLIYIDPPFDAGEDFTVDVPLGDGGDAVGKDQSFSSMVTKRYAGNREPSIRL